MPPDTMVEVFAPARRALPEFASRKQRERAGNGGLAFERFGGNWSKKDYAIEAIKRDWVRAIEGEHGDCGELARYAERIEALAKACATKPLRFTTKWRLVVGMGIANPLENGLTWHRTLAAPYLPGSGVKGLVKAYVEEWADPGVSDVDIRRIFGSTPRDEKDFVAGSVVFHDATPTTPVKIVADVMTPHQTAYYRDGTMPRDTEDPTPIVFAAVQEATFQFALTPACRYVNFAPGAGKIDPLERALGDCESTGKWLEKALELLGAGAKTKSGYGRMKPT